MKHYYCYGVKSYWSRFKFSLKRATALVLLASCTTMGWASTSLTYEVNLAKESATLKEVVDIISQDTDYSFIFKSDDIDLNVDINLKENSSILEILESINQTTDLGYEIDNNTIVIYKKAQEVEADSVSQAKEIIKGRVVDTDKEPLIGANVKIKDSTLGTITDYDGLFQLEGKAGDIIEVSFIGYKPYTVKYNNQTNLTIVLQEDSEMLDEIVVVGYGVQKKVNLTGSVAAVDNKSLDSRPLTNLGQGLQGVVPNLNVSNSNGRPGTGASFNIRGTTSINGGSPLVLVDGVQMDPNQINPQDVESISVLKDAASASIYGGRAAYGVILITTKQGKKNTPTRVNYGYGYTISKPTVLPKLVNSLDFANMYREADRNGQISGGSRGDADWIPTDLDIEKIQNYMNNPTPENSVYIDPASSTTNYRYVGNTDWIKEQFPGWAPMQQHNVSISGGGEKMVYIGTIGAFSQDGMIKEADQKFKRLNASVAVTANAFEWLDINMKMTLNRMKDNSPNTGYGDGLFMERLPKDLSPLMPVRHPDGHFSGQGKATNPFALFDAGGRQKYTSDDMWIKGGVTIKPIKNVQIVADYTWNIYHYNSKSNVKEAFEYGAPVPGSYADGHNLTASEVSNPNNAQFIGTHWATNVPTVSEYNAHDQYMAFNLYSQYEKTFNDDHYFKAMVGYNQEEKKTEFFNAQVKNLINPDYPYLNLNNDDKPIVGSGIGDWALIGSFFRLNYIYKDRYLFEVNGRYDGSSRFARGNRWVFSPSVSLGWRVAEEKFFEPVKKYVNDLKLRYSYGKIANQQLSSYYPYIASMGSGYTGHIFGNEQQVYIGAPGLVSSDFTWETVKSSNFGIDMAFLNNRLTTSFDLFTRRTEGMIVAGTPLPAILGTPAPNQNAANLKTSGFELDIKWHDQINKDFSYFVSANLSDSKSKITKYKLNPTGNIGDYYEGYQMGEIWGFVTEGFFQTEEEALQAQKGGEHDQSYFGNIVWMPGDIKFQDLNGNGRIDVGDNTIYNPGDRKKIGNSTPRYRFGLTGNLEYKGLDFTVFFQGVMKRDVVLDSNFFWGFTNEWSIPTTASQSYWTPENPNAYFPRLRFNSPNQQVQTKYIQNGAFIRLKQMTLGYTIPKNITRKAMLDRVRVYITGDNLWFASGMFKSFDPEQSDRFAYPLQKMVSFGIQVGF